MSEIKLDLKGIKLPEGINYIKVKSQASGYNDGVSTVIPYEIKGTLYAPNVKREGDTLEVEIYFGETQYYAVYVDGVVHTVVPRDEQHIFDLSAFGLSAGTHEITIRARGVNYNESPDGSIFTYVSGEETVQISGSWKFEGDYNPVLDSPNSVKFNVNFISNGSSFSSMTVGAGEAFYGDTLVCEYYHGENVWTNEAYRTITFNGVQNVSKEFYNWLLRNAVKNGNIAFTINDSKNQAVKGMTWGEWVESEYNISGWVVKDNFIDYTGYITLDGVEVLATDTIIENGRYRHSHGGGSN